MSPSPEQLESFRDLVSGALGLLFEQDKFSLLSSVLERRARYHREAVDDYLRRTAGSEAELPLIAQELTVGETYFFRHGEQMAAYVEEALPRRNAVREGRPLRVLSAGCSTGEEPYSLAMLARQAGLAAEETRFMAVDVNPTSLRKARGGRYSKWSLRETPDEVRQRWFRPDGSELVLDPAIVSSVEFREGNLLGTGPSQLADLWQSHVYDIIFCRNVLMYFGTAQARAVVERLTQCLAAGGYLFLGHAETLRGLSEDFDLINTHNCFYYRRPFPGAAPDLSWSFQPTPGVVPSPEPLAVDWMETIEAASQRIRSLGPPQEAAAIPRPDLTDVRELQEKERYPEALAALLDLPAEQRDLPEVVLLHAVLLVHLSEYAQTERLCGSLLESAHFSAGAHYLLGLCWEGRGESEAAAAEHRAASRLDPGFAMPRLHLGLLARKAKDHPGARKELEQALLLLQGESSPRLRLYGGGFGREGLVALCRSELGALPQSNVGRKRR